MKNLSLRVFISAAELSADYQAYLFISSLQKQYPHIKFKLSGIGSFYLKNKLNTFIVHDFSSINTIGLIESFLAIFHFLIRIPKIFFFLKRQKIELVILIDSPGVNFFIAKIAKFLKIQIIYYSAPHIFFRKDKEKYGLYLLKNFQIICSLFYSDFLLYKKIQKKFNTTNKIFYIPNPLLKEIFSISSKRRNVKYSNHTILLCPGSRSQEVKNHLPIFIKLIQLFSIEDPSIFWKISISSPEMEKLIKSYFEPIRYSNISFIYYKDYLNRDFDFAIVCSGTISLEITCLGIPNIVIYKLHPISFSLIKKWILKKNSFISIVNILFKKEIIPERIQELYNPIQLKQDILYFLNHIEILNKKFKRIALDLKKKFLIDKMEDFQRKYFSYMKNVLYKTQR